MSGIIKQGVLEIRPTDTLFDISPDAGHPLCTCSRCGARILEMECVIRGATQNDEGDIDKNSKEFRLCELCSTGVKYFKCTNDMELGMKCAEQCNDCK